MKFLFRRPGCQWPCPFGNYPKDNNGKAIVDITYAPGFLDCDGIKGLIEKLRKLLS